MEISLPELHPPNDLLSQAVSECRTSGQEQYVSVWLNDVKEDAYSASYFLRSLEQMPDLEQLALSRCKGKILDVGAGAGAHSKVLASQGQDVTALEANSGFCALLSEIEHLKVQESSVYDWNSDDTFQTILLLMNGFGIAQKLDQLDQFFLKIKSLLASEGEILAEITDYKYSPEYNHEIMSNPEVKFRLMYQGQFSEEFFWLYPNLELIIEKCEQHELTPLVIFHEEETLLLSITHLGFTAP